MFSLSLPSLSTFVVSLAVLDSSLTLLANAAPRRNDSWDESDIDAFWNQGSKLGAAWPDGDAPYLNNLKGIDKMYTWTESCPDTADELGFTCLPQLWGWRNAAAFQKAAENANPPVFLTFNEPQESGQSNMDVASAAKLWRRTLKPLRDNGQKLCSPATSSNPNGLRWVQDFQNECPECEFDYVCIHWYDTTLKKFQDYVNLWHDTFNKPILVTEFALQNFNGGGWQPSYSEVHSFYSDAIPWLNSQSFVLAYFPFGFMKPATGINPNDNLLNKDGSLTDLGSLVISKAGA